MVRLARHACASVRVVTEQPGLQYHLPMAFALEEFPGAGRGVCSFQNRKAEVVGVLKTALSGQLPQLAVATVPVHVLAPTTPYAAYASRAPDIELAVCGVRDEVDTAMLRASLIVRNPLFRTRE